MKRKPATLATAIATLRNELNRIGPSVAMKRTRLPERTIHRLMQTRTNFQLSTLDKALVGLGYRVKIHR